MFNIVLDHITTEHLSESMLKKKYVFQYWLEEVAKRKKNLQIYYLKRKQQAYGRHICRLKYTNKEVQ